jgi:hypothetical protein
MWKEGQALHLWFLCLNVWENARLATRPGFSLDVEIDSEQHERPEHDGKDCGEDRLGSV